MPEEHAPPPQDGPVLLCAGTEPAAAARLAELTVALLADRPATVVAIWEPPALRDGLDSLMDALYDTRSELRHAARHGAEQAARAAQDVLEVHGLDVTTHVEPDERSPWQVVLQLADEIDASVIVAASQESPRREDPLGSQARALAHRARRPLLVVPWADASADRDAPAIVAYDGSDPSRHALTIAMQLLRPRPACVTSVWQSAGHAAGLALAALPDAVARQGVERLDETSRGVASDRASEATAALTSAGWPGHARALESRNVATAIIGAADEQRAAVIVTGTRGRSRIAAALLGSTAESVLRYAGRPVLLVPPPTA